jgi:hypothetical protein
VTEDLRVNLEEARLLWEGLCSLPDASLSPAWDGLLDRVKALTARLSDRESGDLVVYQAVP